MASVRVEDGAFGDRRYERLAKAAGLSDADHALGKMLRLWRQCTTEQRHCLPHEDVRAVLGPRGVEALVDARLGEETTDGLVRIRGTNGRIEWLTRLRENGKYGHLGGRPKRKPKGLPVSNPKGFSQNPEGLDLETPLSLSPSLSLSQRTEREVSQGDLLGQTSLPSRRRRVLERHREAAARLWSLQEQLRGEAIPGARGLTATAERLAAVAERLEAGASEADCEAVLRHYASEAKTGEDRRWFNGETNWRAANFTRALGQAGGNGGSEQSASELLALACREDER